MTFRPGTYKPTWITLHLGRLLIAADHVWHQSGAKTCFQCTHLPTLVLLCESFPLSTYVWAIPTLEWPAKYLTQITRNQQKKHMTWLLWHTCTIHNFLPSLQRTYFFLAGLQENVLKESVRTRIQFLNMFNQMQHSDHQDSAHVFHVWVCSCAPGEATQKGITYVPVPAIQCLILEHHLPVNIALIHTLNIT